jgi:hypothetical protein
MPRLSYERFSRNLCAQNFINIKYIFIGSLVVLIFNKGYTKIENDPPERLYTPSLNIELFNTDEIKDHFLILIYWIIDKKKKKKKHIKISESMKNFL